MQSTRIAIIVVAISQALAADPAPGDFTPLQRAAYVGDAVKVKGLLAESAPVDAVNGAGATALLYGAGDAAVVQLLLEHGADPNHAAASGMTPLFAAAARDGNSAAVKLLLAHGANVHAKLKPDHDEDALTLAIHGGDHQTIALLLAAGAKVNPAADPRPLNEAAFQNDMPTVQLLLARGADPNAPDAFLGSILNVALYAQNPDVARVLIEHGADPRVPSVGGYHTPSFVLAAYDQGGDDRIARQLNGCGVGASATNDAGETALSYALKTGPDTPLVAYLHGLHTPMFPGAARNHAIPNREVAAAPGAREAQLRAAAQNAIAALQVSSRAFLEAGVVRDGQKCISCHQQLLPAVMFAAARDRGLRLDGAGLGEQFAAQRAEWGSVAELTREVSEPIPDMPVQVGYNAEAWHAWGQAPDEITAALGHYTLAIQRADGSWSSHDHRPPIEDGLVTGTAWSVRMLQFYPPPGEEAATRRALARAQDWLTAAKPETLDTRVFQLFGLDWAGRPRRLLGGLVAALLREQRPDGGWAQLPGRESDAYATGETLVALHQSGGLPTADPSYQRGVAFLLRTQFPDGSWWVRSRTWPFQPHFNGLFPHGKDQWVSAAGTAWATRALLDTLSPNAELPPKPTPAVWIAAFERSKPAVVTAVRTAVAPVDSATFARTVQPILERSCIGCHSGKSPRGGLSLADRSAALKGGQSGDPAIVPGYGEDSPLVHMVADEVEDLEMPPLNHRKKYPALSREEIESVRSWIDEGAPWAPAGIKAAGGGSS